MSVRKLILMLPLALLSAILFAANDSGAITGRVSGPENATIAGARITAIHLGTHHQTTGLAADSGEFILPMLSPGPYRVTISMQGSRPFVRRYVKLRPGETLRLDTKLEADGTQRVRPANGLARGSTVRSAGRPSVAEPRAAFAPPAIQQYGEVSHNLDAIVFVDANTGWAVGEPHWDQATLTYKGSIIKTTNGGAGWSDQDPGSAETFQGVSFLDANQGWVVGTNGTILHTTDGGAHWNRQAVASTDDFSSVFFTDSNNGWATCNRPVQYDNFAEDFVDWQGSIWHTADGGRSWTQQTLPTSTSLLKRIDFIDSQRGWAAGLKIVGYDAFNDAQLVGAIYGTSDGGRTWTEQFATTQGLTFTALHFVDASNGWAGGFPHSSDWEGGCVFHTADGGKTWQAQNAGEFYEQVRDLHFADRLRGYAVGTSYAGSGPVIWRTPDGGATWQSITIEDTNPLTDEGLWAVAVTGNLVVAVGDRDLQTRSTHPWDVCGTSSTCASCTCIFNPSYINPHYLFQSVFFVDQTHGWVAGSRTFATNLWGQVILATQDGGKTWTTQYEHAPASDTLFSYHRLDRIYFTNARNGWAVGSSETYSGSKGWEHHGAIVHTADGGQHWTEQGAELYADWDLEFFGVQFLNDQEGWVIADDHFPSQNIWLAHTTNGGNLWSWVDTGIPGPIGIGFGSPLGGVAARDSQHAWGVGGRPEAVYTTDGGAHWTAGQFSCADPLCGMRCYAVTFADSQNGWIAGGDYPGPGVTLYQTTDGGAHWKRHTLPLEKDGDLRDIQFTDATHGWATGEMGNLLQTTDGGTTWTYVDPGTGVDLLGLRFLDAQHGWIAGDYGTILNYAGDRIPVGQPAVSSASNSASFLPAIAPATWISIFGANLSTSTRAWNSADFAGNKLPTQLDGVRVNINGKPGFLSYISPNQVNVLAPDDNAAAPVPIEVATSQGGSDPFLVQAGPYSPSLFRLPVEGGVYVIGQTTDGKLVGNFEVGYALGIPTKVRDARPGEIITLYGTGFGSTSPLLPTDTLVGQPAMLASPVIFHLGRTLADVVWAGLTGSGLYQFNIRIPDVNDGDHIIVAEINGYRTQSDSVISVSHH